MPPALKDSAAAANMQDDRKGHGIPSSVDLDDMESQSDFMSVEIAELYDGPFANVPPRRDDEDNDMDDSRVHAIRRVASPRYLSRKSSIGGRRSPRKVPQSNNRPSNQYDQPYHKPKRTYNPPLPPSKKEDEDTCTAHFWGPFTRFCTLLIPDCLICTKGAAAKQAWREKVTIFMIMIWSNVFFLGFFSAVPLYFCNENYEPLAQYEWYDGIILGPVCQGVGIVTYVVLYGLASLLVLQCICSLILGMSSLCFRLSDDRPFTSSDMEAPVMVMVPCYNEGERELRKTINSILESDYPNDKRVLLVVADGIITGRGEWINTPRTLARILGFEVSRRDKAYAYQSIGASTENRASIYHGVYTQGRKSLKYMVVVKRGLPSEKDSARPGNRGKRDSQLIVLGLFNRVHHYRKLTELDTAMCNALISLQIPLPTIQYLLAIDADTRISVASVSHMVYNMDLYPEVLACCGETRVDNKTKSWVTMIQVYEYFASHHLKKSFESVFGCVTCLPGCFTMYRMFSDDCTPLVSADTVYQAYSRNDIESLHEKNLYHLGEDRMLTTLLLKYFPDMRLSFVPLAACWTIVPEEFAVLLSQRRRWINSTFHNMWELLKVNTMCGICCLSMNAVVFLDMISTLILPASILYTASFVYVVVSAKTDLSLVTLVSYGIILGVQVVIFLVRSRCDYILWFILYTIFGIPVFFFILPIYSFWHMDDFSWGSTRQVAEKKGAPKIEEGDEDVSPKKEPVPEQQLVVRPMEKEMKVSTHSKKAPNGEGHRRAQSDGQGRDRKPRPEGPASGQNRKSTEPRKAPRDNFEQMAREKPPSQPVEGQTPRRTNSWDSAYQEAEQYLADWSAKEQMQQRDAPMRDSQHSAKRNKKLVKDGSRVSDTDAGHSYVDV